jgi:outer membrane protein
MRTRTLLLALALPVTVADAQDLLATYELALQRDPRLRAAEATRNAVLEAKPQSIARLLPTLSARGALNRNHWETNSLGAGIQFFPSGIGARGQNVGFWDSSASVNLSQPIYHHEIWVQLSQADNQIAQAEAAYAAEQQNTALRTAQAYFNVLLAQDNLEFAEAEKLAIERQLEQARARFDVGLIPITDVNEAQAGYDQARANEIKAVNDLDNARESLREIIGEYEERLSGLAAEIPLKSPEPADIEAWNKRAQENNLDIISAQNRSELAKKSIDLQFAGHLPTLDLVGSAGFVDNNRPGGFTFRSQAIGMEVNIPLFEGGAVNSRVRQARQEFQAAQETLDTQRRTVTRQVKNAYRGILSSISQVAAFKAAVISAQSALEATEAGFEVGTRTMVEVLTEQRNLYAAQRNYAQARYDYIVNSLSLKQASSLLQREDIELVNSWLSHN